MMALQIGKHQAIGANSGLLQSLVTNLVIITLPFFGDVGADTMISTIDLKHVQGRLPSSTFHAL